MITVRDEVIGQQYKELRWNVIRYMEEEGGGVSWNPYVDDATPPQTTIGVGFNIQGNDYLREQVYELLGFDAINFPGDQTYINRLDIAIQDNDLDELDAIMLDRYNDATFEHRVGMPDSFTIPHDDLDWATEAIREIFDEAAGDPVNPDPETFESRLDAWIGSETLVTSSERVALLSLMYNNVLPSSENLQDAVRGDERIRAWFEIRYARDPENGSGRRNSGYAKRRAHEAALFGLYDNGSEENSIVVDEIVLSESAGLNTNRARWPLLWRKGCRTMRTG